MPSLGPSLHSVRQHFLAKSQTPASVFPLTRIVPRLGGRLDKERRKTFEPGGLKQGSRVKYPTEEALRFNQQDMHVKECPTSDFVVTRVIIPTWMKEVK